MPLQARGPSAVVGRLDSPREWRLIPPLALGGGGSRTRTYEGLASGFTVRPLCRSGHSPTAGSGQRRSRAARGDRDSGLMVSALPGVNPNAALPRLAFSLDSTGRLPRWSRMNTDNIPPRRAAKPWPGKGKPKGSRPWTNNRGQGPRRGGQAPELPEGRVVLYGWHPVAEAL